MIYLKNLKTLSCPDGKNKFAKTWTEFHISKDILKLFIGKEVMAMLSGGL